jgi:hypothetical protein
MSRNGFSPEEGRGLCPKRTDCQAAASGNKTMPETGNLITLTLLCGCAIFTTVGLVLFAWLYDRNYQRKWRIFAEENNLAFQSASAGGPLLQGKFQGRSVAIGLIDRTNPLREDVQHTRAVMETSNPRGIRLAISSGRTTGKIGSLFGQSPVRTGNHVLDDRYTVYGEPVPLVQQAMQCGEMQGDALPGRDVYITLEGNDLVFFRGKIVRDRRELQEMIDALSRIAAAVEQV